MNIATLCAALALTQLANELPAPPVNVPRIEVPNVVEAPASASPQAPSNPPAAAPAVAGDPFSGGPTPTSPTPGTAPTAPLAPTAPTAAPSAGSLPPPPGYGAPAEFNAPQAPRALPANEARSVAAASDAGAPPKISTREWFAALMAIPAQLPAQTKPVSLAEALAAAPDRRSQWDVTHAYWKLAVATCRLQVAHDTVERYRALSPAHAMHGQTAGAAAAGSEQPLPQRAAMMRREMLAADLLTAQRDLAAKLAWRDEQLPLATDYPHAGDYRTRLDEIYTGQSAPQRLRYLAQSLPMRLQAVEAYARSAQAAAECFDALLDMRSRGGQLPEDPALAVDALARQFDAWLGAVERYNLEIAEYALAVAAEGTATDKLAGMMILLRDSAPPATATSSAAPRTPIVDRNVQPTAFDQPVDVTIPAKPAEVRQAQRPQGTEGASAGQEAALGLYPALRTKAYARAAQELAAALHWDQRELPADAQPLALADCISAVSNTLQRRAAVGAYWEVRQAAARVQVLRQKAEQLEELSPAVAAQRATPQGAALTLRLQSARLAAAAELADAQASLFEAQERLARSISWNMSDRWPWPSTAPHGGRYRLVSEASGANAFWRERVPARFEVVERQAVELLLADSARAQAVADGAAGRVALAEALGAIDWQAQATQSLLGEVSLYNMAIADYALAVLPEGAGAETVVAALVLAVRQ